MKLARVFEGVAQQLDDVVVGERVVCAGQRIDQEGSSPSGSRMRRAVSKGGGNASSAAGGYGET